MNTVRRVYYQSNLVRMLTQYSRVPAQGQPDPIPEPINVTDYSVPNLMNRLDEIMRLHTYLAALHRLRPTQENAAKRHAGYEALRVVELELSLSLGEDQA
jgi:hypothetical protein